MTASDTWDGKGQADVVKAATGGAAEAGGIIAALLVGRAAGLTHARSIAQQAWVFLSARETVAAWLP